MKERWTWIEIAILLSIAWILLLAFAVDRCKAAELPMKIDTTGIDTVGWEREEVKISCGDYDKLHDSPGFHLEPRAGHWKTIKIPILEYTTDTTYYLSPLEFSWVIDLRTWQDIGFLSPGDSLPSEIKLMNILRDSVRVRNLIKWYIENQSYLKSPDDNDPINDSIFPEWNLGKPLKQKTPDRE